MAGSTVKCESAGAFSATVGPIPAKLEGLSNDPLPLMQRSAATVVQSKFLVSCIRKILDEKQAVI
ncbi:hypothetical protein [Rhizobiales bacterium]|jgi:hypothetical protein|uniref:hypothetical protein n=1 Tax=Neorhizobium sp. DAR64872/K0K18 TaxID=3421958 RepID=UPI0013AF2A44